MNKKSLTLIMLLSCLVSLNAEPIPKEIVELTEKINPSSKILAYATHNVLGGVHHIRTDKGEYVVSSDLQTLFPTQNTLLQKDQKGDYSQIYIPIDLTDQTSQSSFKIGNGEKKLFAFISPICPKSNSLYKKIYESQKIKKNYTIHFFIFPRKTQNTYTRLATQLSNHILNAQAPEAMYYEIAQNPTNPKYNFLNISKQERENYKEILKAHNTLAKKVGAIGTPLFYEKDAKPFYLTKEDL